MTHDRLEESLDIDRASSEEIVQIIAAQDVTVAQSVYAASSEIARAIEAIADRMRSGGRLFYAGAGTSGRIAMLDASELHPTFGISPDLVQVIMAGGQDAFFSAVEGAEDDENAAIAAVAARVNPEDAVVGIAASGTTPFTVAALRRANQTGALTVGVTSVPNSPLSRECDIPIVTKTGPEVILGSSRMKSGTAQKMVLNAISTGVMVRLGRVYSNLMVAMPATNAKLRRRAVLMVELASSSDFSSAENALGESDGDISVAILMLVKGISAAEARRILDGNGRNLREALEH